MTKNLQRVYNYFLMVPPFGTPCRTEAKAVMDITPAIRIPLSPVGKVAQYKYHFID